MANDPRKTALLLDMERHSDFEQFQREQIADRAIHVLDAADPLRALLADEDRAVELMAAAAWDSDPDRIRIDGPWSEQDGSYRSAWLAEHAASLAALREVAGL